MGPTNWTLPECRAWPASSKVSTRWTADLIAAAFLCAAITGLVRAALCGLTITLTVRLGHDASWH